LATRPFVVPSPRPAQPGEVKVDGPCSSALSPTEYDFVIHTEDGLEEVFRERASGSEQNPCLDPARKRLAVLSLLGVMALALAGSLVWRFRNRDSEPAFAG
jgi:hypothetical protein